MNKAYTAFWTCKDTYDKTWGLKPRVLHWIYNRLIRPVLSYSSKVWWHRVRYNISRTEVNKLHRLAYLVKKMTPKAAMEVLLGLSPLHGMNEVEAMVGIYKLMCTWKWRPKSTNFDHTKKILGHEAWTHPTDEVWQDASEICILQATPGQVPWQVWMAKWGLTQTTNEAWSGTQMDPKPITAPVLGCIIGLEKGAQLQSWVPHHSIPGWNMPYLCLCRGE